MYAVGPKSRSDAEDLGYEEGKLADAAASTGFFKTLLSPSKDSPGKKTPSGSGSLMPKKFMDMIGIGPLLNGRTSKGAESKALQGQDSLECINSARTGLTEYVNKMQISETGKRSKTSNDSSVSASSAMSTSSIQAPATPAAQPVQHIGFNVPTAPQHAAYGGLPAAHVHAHAAPAHGHTHPAMPMAFTSNLDRLLDAARHCRLPQNGKPIQPQPADPLADPPRGPNTLLTLAPTVNPRMQRPNWCLSDYTIGDKLYTGYASTVYKAVCKLTGEVVVLKIYHLLSVCDLYKYQIYREVKVHSGLVHENIVHLIASFQEGDKVVMVQEYADGNDLFTMLHKYGGRLSERLAVQMVMDPFLRVLQYLHSRAIIHRDIKPENIMFNRAMVLKLGDFGLAIDLREERAVTRAGTLDYMAPEVLRCPYKSRPEENKEVERLHYSARVDAWAVGVLTYELLVGFPPFYDQSRTSTEERILTSLPSFPSALSEDARSFISLALNKNAAERPTILELLHHPWIESYRTRRSMRMVQPAPLLTTPRRVPGGTGQGPATPGANVGTQPMLMSPTSPVPPPLLMHAASTPMLFGPGPGGIPAPLQLATPSPSFTQPLASLFVHPAGLTAQQVAQHQQQHAQMAKGQAKQSDDGASLASHLSFGLSTTSSVSSASLLSGYSSMSHASHASSAAQHRMS